ncbi:MAG: hypothetical protein ABI614_28865 [Planctomycetota bacterium]
MSTTTLAKLVHQGQKAVITDAGRSTAHLVSVPLDNGTREFGNDCGKIKIADDFDAPLPDELWLECFSVSCAHGARIFGVRAKPALRGYGPQWQAAV